MRASRAAAQHGGEAEGGRAVWFRAARPSPKAGGRSLAWSLDVMARHGNNQWRSLRLLSGGTVPLSPGGWLAIDVT